MSASPSLPLDSAEAPRLVLPSPEAALPSAGAFGRALAGFGLLGLVAALGGGAAEVGRAPVGLVSAAGALVLTVPALLVAHPFLSLKAGPNALVAAIARPFARVGDLALGLVPTLLLFRATSGLAPALLCAMLLGLALLGFSLAVRHLVAAERAVSPDLLAVGKMTLLAWTWSGLAFLIGARLGIGVLFDV